MALRVIKVSVDSLVEDITPLAWVALRGEGLIAQALEQVSNNAI
jgi:hypothetical protein